MNVLIQVSNVQQPRSKSLSYIYAKIPSIYITKFDYAIYYFSYFIMDKKLKVKTFSYGEV